MESFHFFSLNLDYLLLSIKFYILKWNSYNLFIYLVQLNIGILRNYICDFNKSKRKLVGLLTDKIQVYFDTFRRVGTALCYILQHHRSMFFLEILLGNDIWNRHPATKYTCHHYCTVMMRTNFVSHKIYLSNDSEKIVQKIHSNSGYRMAIFTFGSRQNCHMITVEILTSVDNVRI